MTSLPAGFETTGRAVEEVASELGIQVELGALGEAQFVWALPLVWTDVVRRAAFVLDVDAPLLAVFIELELPTPDLREDALLRAIARANYGLLPGAFELDFDAEGVRYRSALWPLPEHVETRHAAELLAGSLSICDVYAPAFRAVLEGTDDPDAAVESVETE